ncbi:MAG: hypothetical protein ACI9X8_001068 [Pseudoalteromonas distincta]|jgi:hypothetical protein
MPSVAPVSKIVLFMLISPYFIFAILAPRLTADN